MRTPLPFNTTEIPETPPRADWPEVIAMAVRRLEPLGRDDFALALLLTAVRIGIEIEQAKDNALRQALQDIIGTAQSTLSEVTA